MASWCGPGRARRNWWDRRDRAGIGAGQWSARSQGRPRRDWWHRKYWCDGKYRGDRKHRRDGGNGGHREYRRDRAHGADRGERGGEVDYGQPAAKRLRKQVKSETLRTGAIVELSQLAKQEMRSPQVPP